MTMKRKDKCPWHDANNEWVKNLHPNWVEHPQGCVYCNGTLEIEYDLDFDEYEGNFTSFADVNIDQSDIYVVISCVCGKEIRFSDVYDTKVCDCGRIYRFSTHFQIDEQHVGNKDWLLAEDIRLEEERHKRYSK